ncbi:YiiX/YebB-like N1pC/P60 family cysteine hydrolase [Psychroserpens sp.]|uniref:YiiX/YebB-like N1pC/P60 family cysteine hydrolase n=1 Tax=Psychroserpens sp. TaxID=2020870 RepID=UPI001AFD998B|nr:YiiX/YebB-like N1pC/P60 family cysteine hydrolase [Psychroserpens sp.]MBO6607636.1 hypothetical protein [Psychroserpens sp.]MBO6631421.1 hypothetical protein [Psychroserpens sp.]MBO6655052.1 hypothetical protein [Psychroserpens sp.]MBO6683143.1 hypothetical protein [Psychroserpens sp.]MBO6749678.1 hypothetical protein [Psychroserpens sp.]
MRGFHLFILILILLLGLSCDSNTKNRNTSTEIEDIGIDGTSFQLMEGDLLFQDSDCGPFCDAIEKVTEGINGAKFSHVGLVIRNDDNELVVIEAITDGVVITSLDSFFARSYDNNNNSKVVVGRLKEQHRNLIPEAIEFSKTKLDLQYDDVFNISNNKYYCSELIYEAYKHANDGQPIFELQPMTYKDPETNATFSIWEDYFNNLNVPIPEGKPGLNPGGMSKSTYIEIVFLYGKPQGYKTS